MHHSLFVKDYRTFVKLGWHPHEWDYPQEVRMDIECRFRERPYGTRSDQLEDTVCYEEICETIRNICEGQKFKLMEILADGIYESLRSKFIHKASIAVTLHKVSPPIPGLQGGVFYRAGDFL